MNQTRNWAGNYKYGARNCVEPESAEQVRDIVANSPRIKVLGTRHSFNGIADTDATHLSLGKLNRILHLDAANKRVTVEGGVRYGELGRYLHENGFALHNLASLPHISVAGACATATHGSGDGNGNLAVAVHAMEIVKADGETVTLLRDKQGDDFAGAVVGLGGIGVVTKLTLDVQPTFSIVQDVYDRLPFATLKDHLHDVFSGAYSVSLFTDWRDAFVSQVWVKRRLSGSAPALSATDVYYGAVRASDPRHPVSGHSAESCSEQLGVPGPWHERLPHFRLDFTPSAGEELQSEYFVAREHAYEALCAIDGIRERIAPLLHVSEVRTVAADELWMSPCFRQHSVGIHFTWKADMQGVSRLLPVIEERLAPFHARPHWAKLFAMPPARLQSLYAKLPDFRRLLTRYDPHGKFRNDYLNTYIFGD